MGIHTEQESVTPFAKRRKSRATSLPGDANVMSTTHMTKSRQEHLDSLRGIAALIVVIVHFLAAFYPYTVFGLQGSYQQHLSLEKLFFFPPFGLFISGHFAVCLFFILSGYVLSYGYLGKPNQTHKILVSIVKRPIRLGGLVWSSIIIGFFLWHFSLFQNAPVSELSNSKPWFSNFWSGDPDFLKFIVSLTSASFSEGNTYNPPLWTIKIELYGSMMVYLFLLLFGGFKYRILLTIALVLLFKDSLFQGFWIGVAIADIYKNYNFTVYTLFKKFIHLVLYVLFVYFSSYPNYVNETFLASTPYYFLPNDAGFGGGYPMFSALLIFILAVTNKRLKEYLNNPMLKFFGKISYAIYVTHLLIIGSLSSWLFLQLNNDFGYHLSFLITFVISLLIIVVTSHMATSYIDNPSIKLANVIGRKIITGVELAREYTQCLYNKALITRRCTRTK
ncbi:acyltransferase [Candidatus Venteria ishoeyi]|uniref:acyltransferase family protein n=1 Tax=Candidatus Venteria ishoeyi TaxID=1899563 RepID=UPI0025A50583|nr:acyltransferase [Candidatus Venteria ishoeyi]MDM8545218.1 acyltransferase [Candidatus Venteria ishoeyi]